MGWVQFARRRLTRSFHQRANGRPLNQYGCGRKGGCDFSSPFLFPPPNCLPRGSNDTSGSAPNNLINLSAVGCAVGDFATRLFDTFSSGLLGVVCLGGRLVARDARRGHLCHQQRTKENKVADLQHRRRRVGGRVHIERVPAPRVRRGGETLADVNEMGSMGNMVHHGPSLTRYPHQTNVIRPSDRRRNDKQNKIKSQPPFPPKFSNPTQPNHRSLPSPNHSILDASHDGETKRDGQRRLPGKQRQRVEVPRVKLVVEGPGKGDANKVGNKEDGHNVLGRQARGSPEPRRNRRH